MKNYFILLLLFLGFGSFYSCGNDADCSDFTALQASVETEFNAFLAANTAFIFDASSDNCNALRGAVSDYLNVLNDIQECVPDSEREGFDDSIEDLELQLDDLMC